jgi:uncharacterized surface protein with fasciclin (FAS1) repeats
MKRTALFAAILLASAAPADTLNGPGPFAMFAPTNEAFATLPTGAVDNLAQPENKAVLAKILTYHVVAGSDDTNKLRALILGGNGAVSGSKLWLMMNGSSTISVKDERGDIADVTIADVRRSNGVIQVVDHVLHPAGATDLRAGSLRFS